MTDRTMLDIGAREICANAMGFQSLARLSRSLSGFENAQLGINCKSLTWIDAQLGACLLTIANHAKAKGNEVIFYDIAPRIQIILKKNNTLAGSIADSYGTTIPVTGFETTDEIGFANFSRKNLNRREMPRMSNGLTEKFFEGVDELFANSSLHSNSPIQVFVSGQYFPRADKLTFVLSDGGRGIRGSLLAAGKNFTSTPDAIDWAMQMNNSARSGDIPGGLGLGILKEFITLNGGSLLVCSQDGIWEVRSGVTSKQQLSSAFPGTVVSLEINTSDTKSYHMASSVNPHEIW